MKSTYRVEQITSAQAAVLVKQYHYKGTMPGSAQFNYGLFDGERLLAAVVFGPASSPAVATSVAPEEFRKEVIELNRLVVDGTVAERKNIASQLVSGALRLLPKPKIVVSYADAAEGHVGYVYQATNFLYAGAATSHDSLYMIDGKPTHSRTLTARGITAPKAWAREHNIAMIAPQPKHRYVYVVADKRDRKKYAAAIKWKTSTNYPKKISEGSTDSGAPVVQTGGSGAIPTPSLQRAESTDSGAPVVQTGGAGAKPGSALSIDFETRAVVDLNKTGVYPYAKDKNTDIWVMAYAFEGDVGDPLLWHPGEPFPRSIEFHIANGGEIRAWNAQFERVIWDNIMVPRYGAPTVKLEQWVDTAAEAAAMALPRHLEGAARVTGVAEQKDDKGYRLMLRLTHPKNRREAEAGAEPIWDTDPEKHKQLDAYCQQDVRTEQAMVKVVRRLTPREREVYLFDQRMNDRGLSIDRPLVVAAQRVVDIAVEAANDKIYQITKGEVDAVTSAGQMREWLGVESINKAALKEMLAGELTEQARLVLQLRSDVGRSSVAKLQSMLDFADVDDDRMRGMQLYHAAGTGRWGGKGPQPHNFPRGGDIENIEQHIPIVLAGDYEAVEAVAPPVLVIMEMLRSMMVAAPGHELIAADYSAIEARVLNWLAGQEDVIELFRKYDAAPPDEKPRYDPYRINGARLFGIPLDEVQKFPHRHMGKFQELGCGFQMGHKKAVSAAKDIYQIDLTLERAKTIVDDYRTSHQEVVQFWWDAENAVIAAVDNPGLPIKFGDQNRLTAIKKGAYLYIGLPSGRPLVYAAPKVGMIPTPWGDLKRGVEFLGANSMTKQWGVQRLYGGLIVENIVQAVARDLMAEGSLRAEAAGYPPVLLVHDEVVAEVPDDFGSVEEYEKILTELPTWAEGCPIAAEGWRGRRYKK